MSLRFAWVLPLFVPSGAMAAAVYLNGVNVDGLSNQKFEKATVTLDERGDVRIDAPGYKVQAMGGTQAQTRQEARNEVITPGVITKRYWLVTEQPSPGKAEYDIDVFVNSKWIRKLRSEEEQIVTDITRYLSPGLNKVVLTAKKRKEAGRKSFSPEDFIRVTVGEGNQGGEQVMIDNPLITFKRSAADTDDRTEEFTVTAR